MSDLDIEREIVAKGLTASRVTPQDIEANIAAAYFFTGAEAVRALGGMLSVQQHENLKNIELLTFCMLVLKNGFTVTGESACASPENFNAEIGRKIARENAINKVWPLMGYELKCRLFAGKYGDRAPVVE